MIDICQWRVSIGLWYSHQVSYSTIRNTNSTNGTVHSQSVVESGKSTFPAVVFVLLLLILSGDIELNPGPKKGILYINHINYVHVTLLATELLQSHLAQLVKCITPVVYSITDELFANQLIPFDTSNHIRSITGESDYRKASNLVHTLLLLCSINPDPVQYLTKICNVILQNQTNEQLREISISLLQKLGKHKTFIIYMIYVLFQINPLTHPYSLLQ